MNKNLIIKNSQTEVIIDDNVVYKQTRHIR
jgi:hypothetical protein